jgi:AbrB family looped-hinge helix DNA binding protein
VGAQDTVEVEEGKFMFGPVKVGEKGQIVIPVEARERFDISPGDTLLVLGDEDRGLLLVKPGRARNFVLDILEGIDIPGARERLKQRREEQAKRG